MATLTIVLLLIAGFGIGFVTARLGHWARFARLESQLRALSVSIENTAIMNNSTDLPAEWMVNQIDDIVLQEFR